MSTDTKTNPQRADGTVGPMVGPQFRFRIEAKGPGIHRLFKGTANVKSGKPDAALTLMAMLNQIVTADGCVGSLSIKATIVHKPNPSGHGEPPRSGEAIP